ncbi:ROK family transcriptional regulator [Kribbella sp. CA-293567]|uniref:ROK family transcriptional regulator n=1 Tax=Kribbella sp. CA-293567 TaxID=3002436 RepID=UPI0022DD66F7|nr:ROK family transcriptional regulator [Kribbella sp. CA-293567]WBQ05386.1 ROK family transcriptional regulator [Kribbella sp. CA-293567]
MPKRSNRPLPLATPAGVEVLTRILTQGPIPRVEIARRTGLSQAAVTKAVAPLIEAGFVTDQPVAGPVDESTPSRAELGIGRPVSPLTVVPDSISVIGLKVTPTELIGVTTDFRAGIRTVRHQQLTDLSPEAVIKRLAELAKELLETLDDSAGPLIGIGVAVSGDVDARHGVVRDSPFMGWRDIPLATLLTDQVKVPVVVSNDVRALTVAEHWFGVGVDADSFAVVTIGSGVGCGLYINGEVVSGAHGVSGELGHLPLAPGDLVCTCGRRGCVETVASSDAILARVRETTGRPELDLSGAIELAHSGDPQAREAFDRAGEVIGSALAAMVNLVGPELVVIAGEGVADYDLYDQRMRQTFGEHAFGAAGDCRLMLRSHTFDDWARGAATTVIRSYVRGEPPLSRQPHGS